LVGLEVGVGAAVIPSQNQALCSFLVPELLALWCLDEKRLKSRVTWPTYPITGKGVQELIGVNSHTLHISLNAGLARKEGAEKTEDGNQEHPKFKDY